MPLWYADPDSATPRGGTSVNARNLSPFILVVLVAVATLAAEGDCTVPDAAPAPTPLSVKDIDVEAMILDPIVTYSMVREAVIHQDGNTINLVLIVDYATDPGYAQQMGDNFVRMAKTFLSDRAPGKQIGTGKYDYLIGVYYPNAQKVSLGAKVRTAARISW